MFARLQEIVGFLKELGFSVGSLKESFPSFARKIAPFLAFGGSLVFFLGLVYYEGAISFLPASLRMGLHGSGASLTTYFSRGFFVIGEIAASYPTRSYLVVLLLTIISWWITIRCLSLVFSLVNPLALLRSFGKLPKEEQDTLVGNIVSAVAQSSEETLEKIMKTFSQISKYYALFRAFDLLWLILLVTYVFNMSIIVLGDALGAASILGNKCLSFWGLQLDHLEAFEACRNLGFVEPDRYWPPILAPFLVLASWFSLRHVRTFRSLRMATLLVASMSLLFCALRLGEQNGKSDLALWRVQIANEVAEERSAASNEPKEWLLVSSSGDGDLVLFDEGSKTLHYYAASKRQEGLIFLEQVPLGEVGKERAASPALHRTTNVLGAAAAEEKLLANVATYR